MTRLHDPQLRGFASDNYAGVHPEVLTALADANEGHQIAYGGDVYTEQLQAVMKQHFGERTETFPVFNGTGANVTALTAMMPRWGAVIATKTAHIHSDEGGAPERISGLKILTVDTPDGKLTPELIDHEAWGWGDEHRAQPLAVSITQTTELGTLYSIDEIKAITSHAHEKGMTVHMDGARIANAAAALGVSVRTVQRRLRRFQQLGTAGLVDERLLKGTRRSVDPRWDEACLGVLEEFTNASTPSQQTVIRRANEAFLAAVPDGVAPSRTVAYERVRELDHGRYTFGEAKQRRSVAKRPQGVLGQLKPTRPGEYVLLDGYKLDVFAMEPVTMRWVNTELTVAMDLFDRSIKGLRLRPVAAKSADVAGVLFQALTPQRWGSGTEAPSGPYAGVPEHLVLGSVGVLPDTIVIDHGKVYTCEHTLSVCRRLGISVQPAIPNKPTDKPALERFFKSLRLSLLDKLTGYKGPNIFARGHDVERGAFYYVNELEQLIREWVGDVYHRKAHQGLVDPRLPHVELSPTLHRARAGAVATDPPLRR